MQDFFIISCPSLLLTRLSLCALSSLCNLQPKYIAIEGLVRDKGKKHLWVRHLMQNLIMATHISVSITLCDFIVAVPREESNACFKYTMGSSSACSVDLETV